jgi:hypothetical protein
MAKNTTEARSRMGCEPLTCTHTEWAIQDLNLCEHTALTCPNPLPTNEFRPVGRDTG